MTNLISLKKNHPILKIINKSLINLPSPMNINFFWNFGSLLGLCLTIQIITGLFLAMNYTPHSDLAFYSVNHINHNVNNGWLMRILHANGASFFFICVYFHIGRNIYYETFMNSMTWSVGIIILLLMMMTAFLGYVLPWGQMSYWGATVITNLMSAIPYLGNDLVMWIWSGFSINNATLNRFFALHFILPFILFSLMLIHLMFLHTKGSSNPLNLNNNYDKIPFHPYFTLKDILGFFLMIMMLLIFSMKLPYFFNDNDNFIEANMMVTPIHIQPEWYFLFAYSILRAFPNKLSGVMALLMSILILFIMPFTFNKMIKGNSFYTLNKIYFFIFMNIFFLLSWIGMNPVEAPFIELNQYISSMYFLYFILNPYINKLWNKLLM
nr:cytochrome b [Paduniella sp. LP-2022]